MTEFRRLSPHFLPIYIHCSFTKNFRRKQQLRGCSPSSPLIWKFMRWKGNPVSLIALMVVNTKITFNFVLTTTFDLIDFEISKMKKKSLTSKSWKVRLKMRENKFKIKCSMAIILSSLSFVICHKRKANKKIHKISLVSYEFENWHEIWQFGLAWPLYNREVSMLTLCRAMRPWRSEVVRFEKRVMIFNICIIDFLSLILDS